MAGGNFGNFIPRYAPGNFSKDFDNGELIPFWGLTTQLRGNGQWAFLMDNYFFGSKIMEDRYVILQPALRFLGKRGFALDLSGGAILNFYDEYIDVFATPWLSFFVVFNQKKENRWFKKSEIKN